MVALQERVAGGVPRSLARARALPGWWEAALAIPLGLLCLASRLVNIDRYTGSYPEGIRAAQLQLMAAGYRPFADIFSDQGPWLLQVLYPGYLLFGGSLVGVRASVVLASLIGLAGAYWIARQLAGPLAALAALLLLGLSPIYLQFSRLAVAEVLALGPAILAVGCAVRFMGARQPGWLYAAGTLLAASLLIKPITLGTAAPVALAVWLAGGRRWRNLALVGLTTAGVLLLGVLLVGLPEILQQIVQFRLASREAEGWSLAGNLRRLRAELRVEGLALPVLAALGAALAARERGGWPLLAWAAAALGTILAHSPLHSKHFAVVVVALALLAAYGVAGCCRWSASTAGPRRWLAGGVLLAGLALWLLSVPRQATADWRVLTADDLFERDEARPWYGEAAASLAAVVAPGEFVITDHAYLAYHAGRLIPPGLVEASATRVRAGSLTDEMAIEATRRYDARAVLLWADKLADLRGYRRWLTENYVPAKVWAAEGDTRPVLWLRNDERLAGDRRMLRGQLAAVGAPPTFGPWRLAAHGLSSDGSGATAGLPTICPGTELWSVLEWERDGDAAGDYRVRTSIERESSDPLRDDEDEPLLPGVGRPGWLFWVGAVPAPRAPGSYRVSVTLLDGRGRALGRPEPIGRLSVAPC